MMAQRLRLAFIVSHPIQYFAPLYQRLAKRNDVAIKVFFTWHAGQAPVADSGFRRPVAWDIPITEGYEFELVPNLSADPGTHHFFGLRNPRLVSSVAAWQPDVIHVTGWAWQSHLQALRSFAKRGVPTLFRGDSHLLSERQSGPRWWLKHAVLKRVFSWPAGFLVVGSANRAYYQAFGVGRDRLFDCPHSIDVERFAEPHDALEGKARDWRRQLGIPEDACVVLFAAKFDPGKRPLELMRAIRDLNDPRIVGVLVGAGQLEAEVRAFVGQHPGRFFLVPFQNQSLMPVVYRLGDLYALPSDGETWGLAVNEAMACGRPVLVSDRIGCAKDLIDDKVGAIFSFADPLLLGRTLTQLASDRVMLSQMGRVAADRSKSFRIARTEETLMAAARKVVAA